MAYLIGLSSFPLAQIGPRMSSNRPPATFLTGTHSHPTTFCPSTGITTTGWARVQAPTALTRSTR